jgi:hypothetical protein
VASRYCGRTRRPPQRAPAFCGGIGISNALFRQAEEYGCTRGLSRTPTVGPGSGIFRAIHRSEAPGSGAFWPHECTAKGDGWLGEMNRKVAIEVGSGYWESVESPRHGSGRCPGGEARPQKEVLVGVPRIQRRTPCSSPTICHSCVSLSICPTTRPQASSSSSTTKQWPVVFNRKGRDGGLKS